MTVGRANVTEKREDISRFVVHLTRDDTNDCENGARARNNFLSILKERRIRAFGAHCLHKNKLEDVPEKVARAFRVSCFTEVPLNQIHLLTQPIKGRQANMEPYGFVFKKEFLIHRRAQPAIYVNSYGGNTELTEAVDEIFETARRDRFPGKTWRVLPFVNAMHERYDFTWEREWRIVGSLKFTLKDLVCIILPEEEKGDMRKSLTTAGLAVISPGWTYEQIVGQLAAQQREARHLLLEKFGAKSLGARKTETKQRGQRTID